MAERTVFVTYSSPKQKRTLARVIFWMSALMAALLLWSVIGNYGTRKEKGYDPLPISSLIPFAAPLMLAGLGLWIGWGQVRIDTRRGTVERRPLGIPLFRKTRSLSSAKRLYVGFYRAPTTLAPPNAGIMMGSGKGTPYWFVRADGEDFGLMLVVQRPREEAAAFARELAGKFDLPVEFADAP